MTHYSQQVKAVYETLTLKINRMIELKTLSNDIIDRLMPGIHYIEEVIEERDDEVSKEILEKYFELKETLKPGMNPKEELKSCVRNLRQLSNLCKQYRYAIERIVGSGVQISKSNPQYLLSKQKEWKFIKKTGESS